MRNTQTKRIVAQSALLLIMVLLFCTVAGYLIGISFAPVADALTTVESYYESLDESLTGTAFRSQLEKLITDTHKKKTTYDGLADVYKTADAANPDNPNGKIIWFYTGTVVSFSGFGSGNGTTNREHVWPKDGGAAFPERTEAGSDAHHLRPTEAQLNSTRGNKSFDEVSTTAGNIAKQNGSTNYGNLCYTDSTFFYPGEGYRGATARILMYVQVRWGTTYQLKFVDSAGKAKTIGKISTLLKWHLEEPPTQEELARNEAVYKIQGNRNPFIDHPEYATQIYCYDGESYNNTLKQVAEQYGDYEDVDVEQITLNMQDATLAVGESVKLNATVTPSNASRSMTWISSNKDVATVDADGRVTAHKAGVTTIVAQSTKTPSVKASVTIYVKDIENIQIEGLPSKTEYFEGDTFDPSGLRVVATYTDGSTGIVDNANCEWFDANTQEKTLSKGTTEVICKVGTLQALIGGIKVKAMTGGSIVIIRSSFSKGTAYNWIDWTSGNITGKGFMYPGNEETIQINSSKSFQHIFNTTALPGNITSITITLEKDTKNFKVYTADTPFSEAKPSGANVTEVTSGNTCTINTPGKYFAIDYASKNACYITSIEIRYGGSECEHEFGEWIEQVDATCESDGTLGHYQCSKCQEYFDIDHNEIENLTIGKLSHTVGEWIVDENATCSHTGLRHNECTVCGTEVDVEEIEKLPHTPSAWIVDEEPTCSHTGLRHKECSVCGNEVDIEEIDMIAHKFGEWTQTTAPTCLGAGEQERTCSVCGNKETQPINALGHDFEAEWTIDIQPSCTTVGRKSHHCTRCDARTDITDIETIAHTPSDWIFDAQANCLQGGQKHIECIICHTVLESVEVQPTGHIFGEWYVSVEPTQTTKGEMKRECENCDVFETRVLLELGHTHTVGTSVVVIDATCTQSGSTTTTLFCQDADCGVVIETSVQTIPALGHDFETEWTIDVNPTCSHTGEKSHHCTRCDARGDVVTLGTLEHTPGEWGIITPATCTQDGLKGIACVVCGKTFETEIIAMTGHTMGDWVVTIEPTYDDMGMQERHCINCDHVETQSSPVLDITLRFAQEVANVLSATSQQEKFEAISTALNTYNSLDNAQKTRVVADYLTLQTAIDAYNQSATVQNNIHNDATNTALLVFAHAISAFAAILFLLKRKMI